MSARQSPRRRKIPDSVKVQVLLRMLGLQGAVINWSHEPALELRAINEDGTDFKPPQHDPNYIFARTKAEHDHITFKDNGTGYSDATAIAKSRRVTDAQEEFRRRVLARDASAPTPERKRSNWPQGRKIQSRPLGSRRP